MRRDGDSILGAKTGPTPLAQEFDATLIYLRRYPGFDLLRQDQRMETVCERIGFSGAGHDR